ncbi:MAG: glycosyltransferase family 4 protein [Stellaceae bacterium]
MNMKSSRSDIWPGTSRTKRSHDPLILHVFSSFAVGGAQVRFAKLVAHLGDRYRHAVVAMDGDYACRSRLALGLDINFPHVAFCKGRTVSNIRNFRKFIRELAPDAMVTSNWGSIEWSMANVTGLVRQIHTEDGFGPEERAGQIARRVWARWAFLRRSQIVVPSRLLHRLATDTWALPSRQVNYIPNGIDCAAFARHSPYKKNSGSAERPLVIGTVAALRPEKNLPRLLRACRQVILERSVRLVIVGDGPERSRLERLAFEMNLGDGLVHFVGHADEPERAYADFDIFALSSDTEQMPLTVIEAMAAGLPIAATDVGDIATMVARENRRFVAGRDHDALAAAIRVLVSDRGLRHRLGAENRAKAFRLYDEATMFAAYSQLLEAAVAGEKPARFDQSCITSRKPTQHA